MAHRVKRLDSYTDSVPIVNKLYEIIITWNDMSSKIVQRFLCLGYHNGTNWVFETKEAYDKSNLRYKNYVG